MNRTFWLDPHDKPGLLVAVMKLFAGTSRIAFEGRVSADEFPTIPGVITGRIDPFHPEFGVPSRMVIFSLTSESIREIERVLFPGGRIVHDIGAIQIEQDGEIQFMAGDNFHRECVSVGAGVPESLLKSLVERGILRSYSAAKALDPECSNDQQRL
jgi:hypothetical protein